MWERVSPTRPRLGFRDEVCDERSHVRPRRVSCVEQTVLQLGVRGTKESNRRLRFAKRQPQPAHLGAERRAAAGARFCERMLTRYRSHFSGGSAGRAADGPDNKL